MKAYDLSLLCYSCGIIGHMVGVYPKATEPQYLIVPMARPYSKDLYAETKNRIRVLLDCSSILLGSPADKPVEADHQEDL